MSCYMVAWDTIRALVDVAIDGPRDGGHWIRGSAGVTWAEADACASLLARANAASVRARYSDADAPGIKMVPAWADWPLIQHKPFPRRLGVVEALKVLHCYRYQACEVAGFAATEAGRFCASLESALISVLPGYDKGPWGLDETGEEPASVPDPPRRLRMV